MDVFWEELTSGMPDARQLVHVLIRILPLPSWERSSDGNERKSENLQGCARICW